MPWLRRAAVLVRTTMPDEETAGRLATALIDEKVAACVHVSSVFSTYEWEGERQGEIEWLVEARTSASGWRRLFERMQRDHPYEVPMVEAVGATVHPTYSAWMKSVLR